MTMRKSFLSLLFFLLIAFPAKAAVLGTTDMGNGKLCVDVDADPTITPVDAPAGSLIIYNGNHYRKTDSGSSTNSQMVTTQGNTFNGANQLVKLDGSGILPAIPVPFSTISTGSNTTATMTVGTGATLTTSGTGVISTTTSAALTNAINSGGLFLGSAAEVAFSSTSAYSGSSDVGLVRHMAGVIQVTDGSTGIGGLLRKVVVEPNTAVCASPHVMTVDDSDEVYTNQGATAKNCHTLPAAAAGLSYDFIVQDADGLRFTAVGDDTIRQANLVTAAAGYLESTQIGSTLRIEAINATEWIVRHSRGTWNSGTFTFGFGVSASYASSPATYNLDVYTSFLAVTNIPTSDVTVNLPLAASVGLGWTVTVANTDGTCASNATITFQRSGGDTFNGAAGFLLNSAYAELTAISDGVSAWTALQ